MSVKFNTPIVANNYEAVESFSELKTERKEKFTEGSWEVTISDADTQETKNGKGVMLVLKFEDDAREHREFFLVSHRSKTAASLGKRKLAQVIRAAGLDSIEGPDDLLGKDVTIELVENIGTGYCNIERVRPAGEQPAEDSFGSDSEAEEDVDF